MFSSFEDYEDSVEEGDYSKGTESVQRTDFGLNISRELTSRLTGTLGLVHDFEDGSDGDKRWYANLGLTYALTENMNLGAWYRFKDVSSDDEEEDYSVNRIGLQLSMMF